MPDQFPKGAQRAPLVFEGTNMELEIEIRATRDLSEEERKHIGEWLWHTFGSPEAAEYEWATPDWHVLVRVDGELVSHVEVVERVGTVDGRPVKLGGIGGVVARPQWRGRGLASLAMEKATAFMRDALGVEFGLLVCGEDMVAFYRRLGWEVVEGPMMCDQPGGKVTFIGVTMVLPVADKAWPEGTIDLCGLPW